MELQQTKLKQPRLMNINLSQISEKFRDFDFDEVARSTGFTRSTAQRVTPFMFVSSFFVNIGATHFSLQDWANSLMCLFGVSSSKQAIDKRTSAEHHANFTAALLDWSVSHCQLPSLSDQQQQSLSNFNQVYLQDSSCNKLPKGCEEEFLGPGNRHDKQSATAKIQLMFNLKNDQPVDLLVTHYRENDQSDASRIIPLLKKNDLLIRDMGYFVLPSFQLIDDQGAKFLSRLKPGVNVYHSDTGELLNLLQFCKQKQKNGIASFEQAVLLGATHKLPVRVLVQQVPQSVYQERRRKAINDKGSKANHSDEYLDLLQWQILITNAPVEMMSVEQGMKMYRLRWRIEVIFKCWKSEMNFDKLLCLPRHMKPARAKIMICLCLAYFLMFVFQSYLYACQLAEKRGQAKLSILKWFRFIRSFSSIVSSKDFSEELISHICRACSYDRRERQNHMQLMSEHQFG